MKRADVERFKFSNQLDSHVLYLLLGICKNYGYEREND